MATPTQDRISAPSLDMAALPARVAALRLKILEAANSGDIERLRTPVEWNEVPPLFQRGLKRNTARPNINERERERERKMPKSTIF